MPELTIIIRHSYPLAMPAGEQIDSARLEEGQQLSQPEFHRRYELLPDLRRAELIEGIVFLESPTRYRAHSSPQTEILHWLKTETICTEARS